ncbi:hypothetical protein B6S59_25265 [Pseudomonas sp. A46]|nr:hypothetical protein [Pseudomonas sp. A46]OWJ91085.1 hypothetical protein B6S59_25265 [Pseudomonas sp. A46]
MNVVPIRPEEPIAVAPTHAMPLCSVLTPELAKALEAVNGLSRVLRGAGIQVEHEVVLDSTIFISADSSDRLAELFRGEWRSPSWTTAGLRNRNMVTLRGVRVVWFTPARGQGK